MTTITTEVRSNLFVESSSNDPTFITKVQSDLDKIASQPVGKRLLDRISAGSHRVLIKYGHDKDEAYDFGRITTIIRTTTIIITHIDKEVLGIDCQPIAMPSFIMLAHELIHAYHMAKRTCDPHSYDYYSAIWTNDEERHTICGKPSLKTDRTQPKISENAIREEHGLPHRFSHHTSKSLGLYPNQRLKELDQEYNFSTAYPSLQEELQKLCGTDRNGELDRAWKKSEELRASLGTLLPKIPQAEALAHYHTLNDQRIKIEATLHQAACFVDSVENPNTSIKSEAQLLIAGYKNRWTKELEVLCGSGFNGEINTAWQTYEALKREFPSESAIVMNAYAKYKELDDRRKQLEQFVMAADRYLTLAKVESSIEIIPLLQSMSNEIKKDNENHRSNHQRLCGSTGFNGDIDRAWKTYKAIEALERYQALEKRRKQMVTRVKEIEKDASLAGVSITYVPKKPKSREEENAEIDAMLDALCKV